MTPVPPSFVNAHCRVAAQCSSIAYARKGSSTGKWKLDAQIALAGYGFQTVRFFNNAQTDTNGFVALDSTTCVVAFRGTQEPQDFLTDAEFGFTMRNDESRVHTGFNMAILSVLGDVVRILDEECTKGQTVISTGHSLGGALALEFAVLSLRCQSCYTFGQPRVGDDKYAALCQSVIGENHFRVVNKVDIVPRSPGPLWPAYRHSGHLLLIDADGEADWNPTFLECLIDDVVALYKAIVTHKEALLENHRMSNYLQFASKL